MTRLVGAILVLGGALSALPTPLASQARQRWSLELAGGYVWALDSRSTFDPKAHPALEVQIRNTFSRWSIGGGVAAQLESNTANGVHASVFVEPRYVLAAGNGKALYAAMRLGAGEFICARAQCYGHNVTLGLGAGGLFRLSPRISLDLGAQYLRVVKWAGSAYGMVRGGLVMGL